MGDSYISLKDIRFSITSAIGGSIYKNPIDQTSYEDKSEQRRIYSLP